VLSLAAQLDQPTFKAALEAFVGSTVRDLGNSVYSIANKGTEIRICRRHRVASNLDEKVYTDLDFFYIYQL
jgi:hypothetical protein